MTTENALYTETVREKLTQLSREDFVNFKKAFDTLDAMREKVLFFEGMASNDPDGFVDLLLNSSLSFRYVAP